MGPVISGRLHWAAIAQAQEAWSRKRITGALLMDAAAAFPSVARGYLLRKMHNMGLGESLVEWTDSFMRERWRGRTPTRALCRG